MRRSPGGGHGNPLHYSCLENPHGQRSLVDYSPWGCKESDVTEQLTHFGHGSKGVGKRERKKNWAVAERVTAVHLWLGWALLGTLRNTNTALPITPGKQGEPVGSPWKDLRPPCGVPPGPRPPGSQLGWVRLGFGGG